MSRQRSGGVTGLVGGTRLIAVSIICRLGIALLATAVVALALFAPTRPLSPPSRTPTATPRPDVHRTWCPDQAVIGDGPFYAYMVKPC